MRRSGTPPYPLAARRRSASRAICKPLIIQKPLKGLPDARLHAKLMSAFP